MKISVKRVVSIFNMLMIFAILLMAGPLAAQDTACDRINAALQEGGISLKDAVLLKADVLFNPRMLPKSSVYRVQPGEMTADRTDIIQFFEEVYQVYGELEKSEKDYLAALTPELQRVIKDAAAGRPPFAQVYRPRRPSAADRINLAVSQGKLSLKEAVLLQAQLKFAPHATLANEEFQPRAGEGAVDEECGTGFFKDVHRVFPELSPAEIAQLKSLDPSLARLLQVKEKEAQGIEDKALPNPADWGLDKEAEGDNCIVHYTLAGANAVPNVAYVNSVKKYMDQAIASKMVTHFRKAHAEGGGKLHVYVFDMAGNGQWVDESTVTGKQKSGYIYLSNTIKSRYGKTWLSKLKGVCFHEYFHGIQSAYNWNSDLWFMEATTVWASCYYAGDWGHVSSYYTDADSIFNNTNQALWINTFRKYSTSVMAFYFSDKYKGYKFHKAYFEGTETEDDAIKVLKSVLTAKKTTFEDQYRNILMALYCKAITSIKNYMPDVAAVRTYEKYGDGPMIGTVSLTGAKYYVCKPEPGNKGTTLIFTFKPGTGTVGTPEGVLMKGNAVKKYPWNAEGRAFFKGFGSSTKEVVLIATDVTYASQDTTNRTFEYEVFLPYIKVNQITADSPIESGYYSNILIYYDLIGVCPPNNFPGTLKVTEKGPDIADNVSGPWDYTPGIDQIIHLYFNTGYDTEGKYKFTFELRVPADEWNIPQSKGKDSCWVEVIKPPESSLPPSGKLAPGAHGPSLQR